MALMRIQLDEAFAVDGYDTLPDPSTFTATGMELRILAPAPGLRVLGIVGKPLAASTLEEIHGDGAGSFQIAYSDVAEQAELYNYGNIVQVVIDGDVRAAWIIRNKHRVLVSAGEEGARVYEVSGPGLRDWFNAPIVYPENPKAISLAKLKAHTRYFNFGSAIQTDWYNPKQWKTPTFAVEQSSLDVWHSGQVSGNPWKFAPIGMPDYDGACWIWPVDSTPSAPAGTCYFRKTFKTTSTGTYELFATGDNTIQAFIDGVPMINQHHTGKDATWRHLWSGTIDLNAGNHVVALKVTNYESNPAGVLAMLYRVGDGKKDIPATKVLATGDSGWKSLAYPDRAPGWSPGEVLNTLLHEAKVRKVHAISALKPTFTNTRDSNNQPWQYHLDYAFDIGTSYYDVVNTLEGMACDVWINPKDFTLNVYNKQGTDRTVQTSKQQPVIFARALNALESNEDSVNDIVNSMLVGYGDEKLMEIIDPYSTISKYGRREKYSSIDANLDKSAAEDMIGYQLEANHLPTDSVSLTISDAELNMPWKDFRVGDWVLAPHTGGAYKKRRVMSIAASLDGATGRPVYELELDSKTQSRQEAIARYMQRHVGVDLEGDEKQPTSFSGGGTSNTSGSGDGSTYGELVPGEDPDTGPVGPGGPQATVYIQSYAPTNVPVGSMWLDTSTLFPQDN